MLLMLKDIPVLRLRTDPYALEIYRNDLLPYYLKDCLVTESTDTDVRLNNIRLIHNFLRSRVLPISRKNAEVIYNMLKVPQDDKLQMALICRGVSLSDHYWVKSYTDPLQWKDVSLRLNALNDLFTQAALCGIPISLKGSMHTPETTTNGTCAKGWKRENGGLYLYKRGETEKREVIVSDILDNLGIQHVQYIDAVYDDDYCAKCLCMTSDQISIVDAHTISSWCLRNGIDFLNYVKTIDPIHFYEMCVVDYLISNSDRHGGNWGFQFYADTCYMIGLHPLYDHDHAFNKVLMQHPELPYTPVPGMSMQEAAKEAVKHIHITCNRPFRREDFLSEIQYHSFMQRLEELTCQS